MKTPKVGFVSLGCPKALVDSERILTQLKTEGYQVASDYDGADLVVVNTCGFIESAVQESLDAIGEAMSENGRVIVTGCLGKDEDKIRQMHPNVLKLLVQQLIKTLWKLYMNMSQHRLNIIRLLTLFLNKVSV